MKPFAPRALSQSQNINNHPPGKSLGPRCHPMARTGHGLSYHGLYARRGSSRNRSSAPSLKPSDASQAAVRHKRLQRDSSSQASEMRREAGVWGLWVKVLGCYVLRLDLGSSAPAAEWPLRAS